MKVTEVHPGYKAMSDQALAEHIRQRVGMNPAWARRALLALYDEHTEAEKADPSFHESNGMGFSPQDQEFLTSLAEQALRDQTFSSKQFGWLYNLLPKYSKQLVKLVRAQEKMQELAIPEVYYIKIEVDNSMRLMRGLTGVMGFDPLHMPDEFVLRSPSNEMRHLFKIAEVYTREGVAHTFVYKAQIGEKEWPMYIEVGEEEELPQWAKDLGKAMGI